MNRRILLYITLLCVTFLLVPSMEVSGKNFVVVIDPGHGGRDPGAVGTNAKEKDINLAVALKLGKKIAANHKDVKIVYTRSTDVFVELDERANIANRNKADLFISIHTNAVKSKTVRGTETYTLGLARTDENLRVAMRENSAILLEDDYKQKYEGFDPNSTESYIIFEFMQNKYMEQSVSFASEIQKGFVACKRIDRGVRQAGLLVLRKTSMPSVLVELGYISNGDEVRYMTSANGQTQLTNALYDAFAKFKREYDRKQGILTSEEVKQTTVTKNTQAVPAATQAKKGQVVYKVQILASNKKLTERSRELKGYSHTEFYVEKGMYKYTYGESTSLEEIKKVRQKVLKDFKDAFIVSFKDGEKVK